jgi:BolA protein
MGLEVEINDAIKTKLNPASFEVINESHLHAGHSGDEGSGESHWKIVLDAPDLTGESRIARHRAVHDALGKDIIGRLHALAISFA